MEVASADKPAGYTSDLGRRFTFGHWVVTPSDYPDTFVALYVLFLVTQGRPYYIAGLYAPRQARWAYSGGANQTQLGDAGWYGRSTC